MNYYLDTEFHEYKKKPFIGKAIDTIELISIGIVSGDYCIECKSTNIDPKNYIDGCCSDCDSKMSGNVREYYAICNEFDLKAAWNNEWLRENVLKIIHQELSLKFNASAYKFNRMGLAGHAKVEIMPFTKKIMKLLISKYGKTKENIAKDIKEFVYKGFNGVYPKGLIQACTSEPINFYAYYADYDWVVFCWLFGRMIDLPKGFPMYCIDLKQELDSKANSMTTMELTNFVYGKGYMKHDVYKYASDEYPQFNVTKVNALKDSKNYPKQDNEHNALADAKWNQKLHKFIKSL